MTPAPRPAGSQHPVLPAAVIGSGAGGHAAGTALLAAGISDFAIFDKAPEPPPGYPATLTQRLRAGHDIIGSVFNDDTDTWALSTHGGKVFDAQVVIATQRSVLVPWIPSFCGHTEFRGESFHALAPAAAFKPAGKHIAVIGTDAAAGHLMSHLAESAASVTVFAHAPRRMVTEMPSWTTRARRWLQRHIGGTAPTPALAGSAIEALTPSGIHTSDGVDHRADTIIFGTGLTVADQITDETLVGARGLTIRQAWDDGMEPYFGVAVHGFPNYFFIAGPDFGAQADYVTECMAQLKRTASTRVEVRRSTQQVFNERAHLKAAKPHAPANAFWLSSGRSASHAEDGQTYDGAATLTLGGIHHRVRVRLTGHLNPIDGNYHWQGMILAALPADSLKRRGPTMLTVGEHCSPARIIEQTPWRTHSIAGIGPPPYARCGHCTDQRGA